MEESQDSEPDLRNSAVRDYRGASGNAAKVELCTRLATKRARTVTLHLQAGAREFYPNNESERRCGLESEKPQGLSLQPEGESSMDRRRLTDAAISTLAG